MIWLSAKLPWQSNRNWRWIVLAGIGLIFVCVVGFDILRLPAWSKLAVERSFVKPITTSTPGTATKNVEWSGDDNSDSSIGPPCLDYPEAKPILLPTSQNNFSSGIIDRLRANIGNASFDSIFADCPVTTQVQIIPKCPFWELQTLDYQGNPKTVGGDEFYITYTDEALYRAHLDKPTGNRPLLQQFHIMPFTAAAWITDLNNGRYRLNFQASPLSLRSQRGRGILAVYFQYTCNIGRMGPPSKENWTDGGNSVAAYRTKLLPLVPPIRPFYDGSSSEAPTGSSVFGRPNLWDYDAIFPVGDSVLQHLMGPLSIEFRNINSALNTSTMDRWKTSVHQAYRQKRGNATNIVFVMGSCVWDILEAQTTPTSTMDGTIGWLDHQKALRTLLQIMGNRYPNATICWRSCSSVHVHVPFLANFTGLRLQGMQQRTKYMSTSRASQLYSIQKQILQEVMQARQSFQEASGHPQTEQGLFFLDVYSPYFLSPITQALGMEGTTEKKSIGTLSSGL